MKLPRHLGQSCKLPALGLLLASSLAFGAEASLKSVQRFDIPAQSASDALNAFSQQSGLRLLFSYDAIEGRQTSAVRGDFSAEEVLKKLLGGTGLHYEITDDSVVLIRAADPAPAAQTSAAGKVGVQRMNLAQAGDVRPGDAPQAAAASSEQERSWERHVMDEVIVTGTNIRNVHEHFSPVTTITRENLDRAGLARVSDYINRLPQNFGGGDGITPDQNSIGAQAINLRGLGNEATLTLLNGRRIAPGGLAGSYADISIIPTAALERVDVLTDGASAIYGSDAIAGVVNFILRKDYEGNETRLRMGTGDGGSSQDWMAAHTVGVTGERGRALLSYEYSSQDALNANDRDFTREMPDPNEILPESRRHSVFFSGALNLGSSAEVFSDLHYLRRDTRQEFTFFDTRKDDSDVEQYGGTLGAAVDFGSDWRAEVSGSFAKNEFVDWQGIDPHPPTYVGMFQGSETRIWSIDAKVDGSLFQLPGGAARAVVGGQFRSEKHDSAADFFTADGSLLGVPQVDAHTSREVAAVFAEMYLPFVSAENAVPGVQRLAMSLAGRYEDYSDFGTTFNPKVGFLWSPGGGVTMRATYGTSFRAARLEQLVDTVNTVILADYVDPTAPGGTVVAAWVSGTRSDLDPEESASWTVGIDFEPSFAKGLKMRATYFDIDYEARLAIPQPLLDGVLLHNFPLPLQPTDPAAVQALVNVANFPLINFTATPMGSQSTIDDVQFLIDSRTTNTSRSRVSGLDLEASYVHGNSLGDWQWSLQASYLFDAEDQFSPLRPVVDKLNTVGNPPDLRIRASMGWSKDASSIGLFVNYVDNYKDIQSLSGARGVASWSTVDASYRYDFGVRHSTGFLSGTSVTFSALNLFDRDPPSIGLTVVPGAGTRNVPYDTANADPEGRIVALQIEKRW